MTNVPMTLPDLVLATHKTPFFHSSTFVELDDGRILHAAGSRFTTSDDGGITWSDISERHDVNGHQVGGGGSSLVKLDGKGHRPRRHGPDGRRRPVDPLRAVLALARRR